MIPERCAGCPLRLFRSSVDGPRIGRGAQEALATDQKASWELAQDCTTIYWTNRDNFGTGEVTKFTK
jgi:hypothetical protein